MDLERPNDQPGEAVSEDVYRLQAGLYAEEVLERQRQIAARGQHTNAQRRRAKRDSARAAKQVRRRYMGERPPEVNRATRRAYGIR